VRYLNLGCDSRYHTDWVNIDMVSTGPGVIAHNLQKGVPFPDNSFDVVYHSHVLEHFSKADAVAFLCECYRVLTPGGVIRVAVPDLGEIVDHYIKWRDLALQGDDMAAVNYDWIMLEMYDQFARNHGGGEMGQYILQDRIPNETFVRERAGFYFDVLRTKHELPVYSFRSIMKKFISPVTLRRFRAKMISLIPGERSRQIGKFRLSGEIHQWMYDRFSLARLLRQRGFIDPIVCSASQSQIPGWTNFHLDTEPDGSIYRAATLFMEARK
jgi:predicted SAM-dependent methyltransferase